MPGVSKYIALEGGDGSGKTTVAGALARRLRERGDDVVVVREPGGTPLGEAVRDLVLDTEILDDWAEAFLFAAQRTELARRVVVPALAEGTWVISDRSYYSSIAYQGRARGLGEEAVREINEIGLGKALPDHVFVLDISPGAALPRQHRADRIGREGLRFQEEVRKSYLALAEEDEKVILLDGSLPVAELVERIIEVTG